MLEPTQAIVDTLAVFLFLRGKLSGLKHKSYPLMYLPNFMSLEWWKFQAKVPMWSGTAQMKLLAYPSSASSERVLYSSFKH